MLKAYRAIDQPDLRGRGYSCHFTSKSSGGFSGCSQRMAQRVKRVYQGSHLRWSRDLSPAVTRSSVDFKRSRRETLRKVPSRYKRSGHALFGKDNQVEQPNWAGLHALKCIKSALLFPRDSPAIEKIVSEAISGREPASTQKNHILYCAGPYRGVTDGGAKFVPYITLHREVSCGQVPIFP